MDDNLPSQKVTETTGGKLVERFKKSDAHGRSGNAPSASPNCSDDKLRHQSHLVIPAEAGIHTL